jgi:Dyp-type peroxidase family
MNSTTIDYSDVQGTILRGYRVDLARHFIVSITNPVATGQLLQTLIDGSNGMPKITTAQRTEARPDSFLNVSFTCTGLAAMGVTAADLKTFDGSFQLGASNLKVTKNIGDVGSSAPQNWIDGLDDDTQVHMLISLWVRNSQAVLETVSAQLTAAFAGAVTIVLMQDANALPDNKVHFGYRDSIAQPAVIGAPPSKRDTPDDQPAVATGEFLLGYTNEIGGSYQVSPAALSTNSSYAAFRILEQDVPGFDAVVQSFADKTGLDNEMVAAKICGRWRNGNPLELSPTQQEPLLPTEQLNNFTYVSPPAATDDTLGLVCPIGSHIRRNNPRNEAIVGGGTSTNHRIVRRAMPYGPAYDPQQPDTMAITRGLVGYFINASIQNQFEFLTSQWNLLPDFVKSATAPGGAPAGNAVFNITGEDVFLGVNDPSSSSFTFAGAGANGSGNTNATGFGRTITTRGSVYCFFPSITGLNYLAALPASI